MSRPSKLFCPRDISANWAVGPLLGNPTVFQNITDSTKNQHVVLLVLQNVKSKISGISDQN